MLQPSSARRPFRRPNQVLRHLEARREPQVITDAVERTRKRDGCLAASFPERDHIPKELEGLGIREYCQVVAGPYRLFSLDGRPPPGGEAVSHVTSWTDDVSRTHRELSQRGVRFTSEPESMPWGTFAIFQDSEGNRFVLSSR